MTDYKDLSDEQLLKEFHKVQLLLGELYNKQKALKILLNTYYGASGASIFRYFDIRNAMSVTLGGQAGIKIAANKTNEFLNKECGFTEFQDLAIGGDTDSTVYDTSIDVNGTQMKIGDLYNLIPEENIISQNITGDSFVKLINNMTTESVDGDLKIVRKPINYIMKHKVKKRMYRVKIGNKSVDITEDESLVVLRNGKLIREKVKNIQNGDQLIYK